MRKQIAQRRPDPVYLIVGDDDAEMSRLASDLSSLVDEDLRAFNVERLYASDKVVTPASIAESARLLPMIASHRVVVVLRAERILKPKRRGKADESQAPADDDVGAVDADALEAYVKKPEPTTVLAFVAADVDRTRRLYKQLVKSATIVECWGLKPRDARADPRQVARRQKSLVKQAATDAGRQIEPAAARLVAERAGTDIARLRGDVEKLMLYSAGAAKISLADAKEVVSAESSQDDWAVTNAISRGATRGGAARARPGARFGRGALHDPRTAWMFRAREAGDDRPAARPHRGRGAVSDGHRSEKLGRRPARTARAAGRGVVRENAEVSGTLIAVR